MTMGKVRDYSNWVTLYEIDSPQGWHSQVLLDRERTPDEMEALHRFHCKNLCEALQLDEVIWEATPETTEQARARSPDGALPWWFHEGAVGYQRKG